MPINRKSTHYGNIAILLNTDRSLLGYHLLDPQSSAGGFQLLGLDLMITNDWHIWFIEANNYPLWPKGGWITEFTTKMGVSEY